jgi:hypothetical protein
MHVYGIIAYLLSDKVLSGMGVATFPRNMVLPASQFKMGLKEKR